MPHLHFRNSRAHDRSIASRIRMPIFPAHSRTRLIPLPDCSGNANCKSLPCQGLNIRPLLTESERVWFRLLPIIYIYIYARNDCNIWAWFRKMDGALWIETCESFLGKFFQIVGPLLKTTCSPSQPDEMIYRAKASELYIYIYQKSWKASLNSSLPLLFFISETDPACSIRN
jgi:hypothetical protein